MLGGGFVVAHWQVGLVLEDADLPSNNEYPLCICAVLVALLVVARWWWWVVVVFCSWSGRQDVWIQSWSLLQRWREARQSSKTGSTQTKPSSCLFPYSVALEQKKNLKTPKKKFQFFVNCPAQFVGLVLAVWPTYRALEWQLLPVTLVLMVAFIG